MRFRSFRSFVHEDVSIDTAFSTAWSARAPPQYPHNRCGFSAVHRRPFRWLMLILNRTPKKFIGVVNLLKATNSLALSPKAQGNENTSPAYGLALKAHLSLSYRWFGVITGPAPRWTNTGGADYGRPYLDRAKTETIVWLQTGCMCLDTDHLAAIHSVTIQWRLLPTYHAELPRGDQVGKWACYWKIFDKRSLKVHAAGCCCRHARRGLFVQPRLHRCVFRSPGQENGKLQFLVPDASRYVRPLGDRGIPR